VALQFDQVAHLSLPLPNGKTRFGSGFLIGDRLVLTAAHVVDEITPDAHVDVAFPAANGAASGAVVWSGSSRGLDAALVQLAAAPVGPVQIRLKRTRWGRLTGQAPGVSATGIGFPRALKEADGERVPDQVDGSINPGTAFGQRYDVRLNGPHPLAAAEDPSPWSGLSGAALFCGDLLVGVIVIDTPNFQSGRLTAVPMWRLLDDNGFTAVLRDHELPVEWESVQLEGLFEQQRARLDSPASLLRADTTVVRFRGREQVLAELRDWCEGSDDLGGLLLVGPGGQGKTRLAARLCQLMREAGWICGFADPNAEADSYKVALSGSRFPALVVLDYAETRLEQARRLVDVAAEPVQPVRFLLLARSAGEWWTQLLPQLRPHLSIRPVMSLRPLEDTADGRLQAYHDAVHDLADMLPRLPGRADVDWMAQARRIATPDLAGAAYASVLTIQLRALTDLLTADAQHAAGPPDPAVLEDVLLEHEQLYWTQTASRRGLVEPAYQPVTLQRSVASATLCGAADEDEAVATVTRIPGLEDKSSDEWLGVARWIGDLYPSGQGRYWGPLQPDRVGEHLIAGVARTKPGLISAVLNGASQEQAALALLVLTRVAPAAPELRIILRDLFSNRLSMLGPLAIPAALAAKEPRSLIEALNTAVVTTIDVEGLMRLSDALPESSLLLAPLEYEVTNRVVELHRALAEADPEAYLPDLALGLNNLSNSFARMGRRAEALGSIEEAVSIRRGLAEVDPKAHLPNLALALNNLSIRLAGVVGWQAEAVDRSEEAVSLYRGLADGDPDVYLPYLAGSLNNLANTLAQVGRQEAALDPVKEAVSIYWRLAEAAPDVYVSDLARSLHTLAITLAEFGRQEAALDPIEEAVSIRRGLAAAAPDAYLSDLAGSLHNLAITLAELGRQEAALDPAEEAVSLYRGLAEADPDLHLSDLARSLHTMAITLAELGRQEAALDPAEEAVSLYRGLAEAASDAYLPDLAGSLNNLASTLAEVGRQEAALDTAEEAVSLYRGLAEADPDAYLPGLTMSLYNLALCQRQAEAIEDGLSTALDSIAAFRHLAELQPDPYLADLRDALVLAIALAQESEQETTAQQLEGELQSVDQQLRDQQ
jgi:broad specificity phosphatase PhoE